MNVLRATLLLFLGVSLTLVCCALEEESPRTDTDADGPPSAPGLLRDVVANLPRERLVVEGALTVRKQRGILLHSLKFTTLLDLGGNPPLAQYRIMDAFGRDLELLTIVRREGVGPEFLYASGNPLAAGAPPDLSVPVQETDITWMDLSLAFLWWPDSVYIGSDTIRGRPCHVIEAPNPALGAERGGTDEPRSAESYAKARLWIDAALRMLLQAEVYDAGGGAVRRLWVKSFKKIDDRWMIKEMEVEGVPVVHRTKLTIQDVSSGPSS